MKHLLLIAASGVALAACTPAPEPIYDASEYKPGKAGALVTSPKPKPRPDLLPVAREVGRCWNEWGQHNNLPGCPWFAEGGGDIDVTVSGESYYIEKKDGSAILYNPDGLFDLGDPDDDGPNDDDDHGDNGSEDDDTPVGGNPGNDKPVGRSNEKRPEHAQPDDGERGNSDNK